MKFFQLIRWKNLLIVGCTQCLIGLLLLYPILSSAEITVRLNLFQFGLLVLTTMLIGAGGYIINDIFDEKIDVINKPGKVIIGNGISSKAGRKLYSLLGIVGLVLSAYLSWSIGNFTLLLLYPIAWILLWTYSHSFKRAPLFGNVIVALFCAFVPGVLLVAEWPAIQQLSNESTGTFGIILLLIYILFAFLTTIIREIVKDIEDIEGDKNQGCRTLPIIWGLNRSKAVILLFSIMLLGSLGYFSASIGARGWKFSFLWAVLAIIIPIGIFLFKLASAKLSKDFSWLSNWMKFIMLAGLVLIVIFRFEVL